jgi:hypothetical protein
MVLLSRSDFSLYPEAGQSMQSDFGVKVYPECFTQSVNFRDRQPR